jgi:hypothetical protein
MSEYFQPGQHPDADTLSAFADDALPAHEREETMLHLAQCADCRSVVYLAQEAATEVAPVGEIAPQLPPQPKPWFSLWTFATTAAAFVACMVLGIVYTPRFFRHEKVVASNSRPAAAQPQISAPATSNAQIEGPHGTDRKAQQVSPSRDTEITGQNLRSTSEVAGKAGGRIAPKQSDFKAGAGLSGRIGTAQSANLSAASPVAAPPPPPQIVTSTQAASEPLPITAYGPAQNTNQVNQLATVNAQSITSNVALKHGPMLQQQFKLPSHLATSSAISDGRLMLAVDFAGTLFASRDAGKHWKSISPHWTGHAVKVELSSNSVRQGFLQPALPAPPPTMDAAHVATEKARAPVSSADSATLTGLVTDRTGAVVTNATVTVTNVQTGQSPTAKSEVTGSYFVGNLAPGTYHVEVHSPGFKTQTLDGVELTASGTVVKNIALDVGAASESVSVQAASSVDMQTETVPLQVTMDGKSGVRQAAPIFELTTDTGEVWTSSDGRHWKRR